MKQLVRYILLIVSMVLIGHGDVSAASKFSDFQDSYASAAYQKDGQYASEALPKKDGLAKVEHHDQQQEAQLENASSQAYRACSERPQRLLPSGNIHGAIRQQVDCFYIESVYYPPFYPPFMVAWSLSARRVPLSTLMSPANIMSFACGVSSASFLFLKIY